MQHTNNWGKKKVWEKPVSQEIRLDKEINIILQSTPPGDPFNIDTDPAQGFNPFK